VATLYIRNVPPKLYTALKRWADDSGRSLNAEMLALLEQEVERREEQGDWFQQLLELRKELALPREAVDLMIQSIREHRDAG